MNNPNDYSMKALLIVDLQNDFLPGGSLAVQGAESIIPIINGLQEEFEIVIASKDWHPVGHVSFASTHKKKVGEKIVVSSGEQILWPDHCVQYSKGSDFPSSLRTEKISHIVYKGSDLAVDSYSAFFDQNRAHSTDLYEYLRIHKIDHLYVVGLATEYCVRATVMDALTLGFKVTVIEKGCMGLDPTTAKEALSDMQKGSATIVDIVD